MQYFTEQGTSHREVVRQIKEKYGDRAQIMTHKNIKMGGFLGLFTRDGVEITGILSNEKQLKRKKELETEKSRFLSMTSPGSVGQNSISGATGSGIVREPAQGKTEIRTDTISSNGMELVLSELKELKDQIRKGPESDEGEHPSLEAIEDLLVQNDFSHGFIKNMMKRVKSELSYAALDDFGHVQDRVVQWIGEEIGVYPDTSDKKNKRVVLIGPTGVGKTTTIAKLAAMSILDQDNPEIPRVRMITIDNYRIGARGQLETYGDIMNIPVASVETRDEMKKKLALFEDIDIIYVDTTGRSQKDFKNIASMRELLEPCGSKAEYFLAISATTKASDIREICREFEPFNYNGIILTKLDETMRIGNIISILAEMQKPLAYVTFGQGVPADIEKASRMRLLKNLEGFSLNVEKMKEKVGE
ncbi:MAG: flagellar biosynthesis protein FlhF [Spirochaetales bacterium]|nr:flagellar biosynthesis protein FlhF [Spirochaetales bacterium]